MSNIHENRKELIYHENITFFVVLYKEEKLNIG